MGQRLFQLYCNHCGLKLLTDGSILASMTRVDTCASCSGAKSYRCKECGYLMRLSKAQTNTKTDEMHAVEKLRQQLKEDKERQQDELRRVTQERRLEEEKKDPPIL